MGASRRETASFILVALVLTSTAFAGTPSPVKRQIVVSIPDRKLAVLEDGQVVKIYRTAVGAPSSPSPKGEFTIIHRIPKPTYYAPGKIIPSGPNNPLGTRWLGLSVKGFGIHGTNVPRSIGKNQSHGCIRMKNRDVEELFERVRIGDRVEIFSEVNEQVATIFSHPPAKPFDAQPVLSAAEITVALVLMPE